MLLVGCVAALGAGPVTAPALAETPAAAAAPVRAVAAQAAASAPLVTRATCPAPSAAALSGFFSQLIPADLARDKIPGAVVSVVSGRTTVLARGYGLADTSHRTPFSPATSLVRIGSITKLLTWTAVMQQVQAGRINLNTDINHYLTAFKVPDTYPEPITMLDLMDHTSGFEDRVIGTGALSAADVPPLGQYLATHMPARIRPPGQVSAYSNYGAALAGYIVTQVTGQPYATYVREHILAPLGMTHTTAAEPVPAALAAGLAHGYDSGTGEIPFVFDPQAPDGSVSATADDMARFMIAQMHGGQLGSHRILSPATAALMDRPSFAANPLLGGYAHGFEDRIVNGHYILEHDGSDPGGFGSDLVMVPGCHLGVFVAGNTDDDQALLSDVTNGFLRQFAPRRGAPDVVPAPQLTSPATVSAPAAGFYEPTRHNQTSIEKLEVLTGSSRLRVGPGGVIGFQGSTWRPQGNGRYVTTDQVGTDHLMFLAGPGGQHYAVTDFSTYQLLPADQSLPFSLIVLLVFAATALSVIALPAAALVRRLRRRPAAVSATWRTARLLTAAACVLGLVSVVLLTAELLSSGDLLYGATLALRLVLIPPLLMLAAAAAGAAWTVRAWQHAGAGVLARVHQAGLLAGLAALTWFLAEWNLLGWRF